MGYDMDLAYPGGHDNGRTTYTSRIQVPSKGESIESLEFDVLLESVHVSC